MDTGWGRHRSVQTLHEILSRFMISEEIKYNVYFKCNSLNKYNNFILLFHSSTLISIRWASNLLFLDFKILHVLKWNFKHEVWVL